METNCMIKFSLTDEDKTLLRNTMYMLEAIANAMDKVDSYDDVVIENDEEIDGLHDFGDCIDEIFDYSKIICNFLSYSE